MNPVIGPTNHRSDAFIALLSGSHLVLSSLFWLGPVPDARSAFPPAPPAVVPEIQVSLFACEPDIVTPIGIAIDARNRIFVVESHTHQRKGDYPGPKTDRVKIFRDADQDGRPEKISIFAEGFHSAMNLAFSPDQELYLVHRNGVLKLIDTNGDERSDREIPVVKLETAEIYPHNGLGGIAFSPNGWMYLGLGENLGQAYALQGTDGRRLTGGGEGGSIVRCRPDGTRLERVATGFWNPFGLEFDRQGELFCIDNDPDGRPPCRLLHIIDQGDYGYQFRYGRSGLHPYVAWDGELPGTLPMVAGTGEAPSGMVHGRKLSFFPEFEQSLLLTSWGDHTVEAYRLAPMGASFRAEKHVVARGQEQFHPVGMAAGVDQAIYLTDWADVQYPVHQKGRIWRLRRTTPLKIAQATGQLQPRPPAAVRLNTLLAANDPAQFASLLSALTDPDPFIRSAAVTALRRPIYRERLLAALEHPNPQIRTGALLALRRSKIERPDMVLKKFLGDPEPDVRSVCLSWIGEEKLTGLSGELEQALNAGTLNPALFKIYLATAELLNGAQTGNGRRYGSAGISGAQLLERVIRDASKPVAIRALAVAMLPPAPDDAALNLLLELSGASEPRLQMEAIRSLGPLPNRRVVDHLKQIAFNTNTAAEARAEAVVSLAANAKDLWMPLVQLLKDDSSFLVQVEAARALRIVRENPQVRAHVAAIFAAQKNRGATPALLEQLHFLLQPSTPDGMVLRPESDHAWLDTLETSEGDPESGRRIFFHPAVGCAQCHRIQGRGGELGPDLSVIARSSTREKLIHSILHPSRDLAPQYAAAQVETKDGRVYSGVLASRGPDDSVRLSELEGQKIVIPADEIASYRVSQVSFMPDGLEQALTVKDFADLLAFLGSLH